MKTVSCYKVTSVAFSAIKMLRNDITSEDFYTRDLVIKMADGSFETIALFGDDGYALLADDKVLKQIQEAA